MQQSQPQPRNYLFETLYNLVRRFRSSLFKPYRVTRRFGGKNLTLNITEVVAQNWYDHDWEKLPEIEFFRERNLLSDALVFDVGAHQGVVAMMIAEPRDSSARVVAVEAHPKNFQVLTENLALNPDRKVVPLFCAIGEKPGKMAMNTDSNGQVRSDVRYLGDHLVDVRTLDDLAQEQGMPNIVFLDIEGFEIGALKGATRILQTGTAHWFIEVHTGCGLETFGGSVAEVVDFFPEDRFQYFISSATQGDYSFLPIQRSSELLVHSAAKKRFYLICSPKR